MAMQFKRGATERRVGRYDEERQVFHIKEIPAPPESRYEVHEEWESREVVHRWWWYATCPHCLGELSFGFERSHDQWALGQLQTDVGRARGEAMRERMEKERLARFIRDNIAGRNRPSKDRLRRAWKKAGRRP